MSDTGSGPVGEPDAAHEPYTRGPVAALWVVTIAALMVHNVEEAVLGLNRWLTAKPWFPTQALQLSDGQFTAALAVVTAVVGLLAVVSVLLPPRWGTEALTAVAYALSVNAIGHIMVSFVAWSLMPGVFTSVFLLLPVNILVLRRLPATRWTAASVIGTVLLAFVLLFGALLSAQYLPL